MDTRLEYEADTSDCLLIGYSEASALRVVRFTFERRS